METGLRQARLTISLMIGATMLVFDVNAISTYYWFFLTANIAQFRFLVVYVGLLVESDLLHLNFRNSLLILEFLAIAQNKDT